MEMLALPNESCATQVLSADTCMYNFWVPINK